MLANHSFLIYDLDPSLYFAYTLQGQGERKGDLPPVERGFPGKSAECTQCIRMDTPLQHGPSKGRSAYDASDEEIKDCIANARLKHDYRNL
jgi:hypothetical protein